MKFNNATPHMEVDPELFVSLPRALFLISIEVKMLTGDFCRLSWQMENSARLEKLRVYHWHSSVSFSDRTYPICYFVFGYGGKGVYVNLMIVNHNHKSNSFIL